jgi:hypothetical protein
VKRVGGPLLTAGGTLLTAGGALPTAGGPLLTTGGGGALLTGGGTLLTAGGPLLTGGGLLTGVVSIGFGCSDALFASVVLRTEDLGVDGVCSSPSTGLDCLLLVFFFFFFFFGFGEVVLYTLMELVHKDVIHAHLLSCYK